MKAVILRGPNDFGPQDVAIPSIASDEILMKMEKSAICGTDIRILEGKKTKDVRYPSVIGHEMCGTVEKVGEKVTKFKLGQRIAVAPVIPCGHCHSCLTGRENACINRTALGYQYDGAFSEYIRIPKSAIEAGNVAVLPDNISFAAGALIEPLACCINGMRNAGTTFGDSVLVVGAGPIGLMHLCLAKIAGASKVIVSEPIESRREKAKILGADIVVNPSKENLDEIVKRETGGLGADIVILAIGVPAIVNSTIKLCKKGGTVCLFAGFAGTGECTIEANVIHYGEINVCGATAYKRKDYLDAAALVSSGKINLDEIVTHVFKIDEFQKAYEVCKKGEGLKVLIEP